jgi:hypothetical protein
MMKRYRLDPADPRRLTPEEAQRLAAAPIDYSDIPPLDDEFFSRAKAMTDHPKPTISAEEVERRRGHVRAAIANSRIEGMATSAAELAILEAYIRGEIEAGELVTAWVAARAMTDDDRTP